MTNIISTAYCYYLRQEYTKSAILLLSIPTISLSQLFLLSKIALVLNNLKIAIFVLTKTTDYRILANLTLFEPLKRKIHHILQAQNLHPLQQCHALKLLTLPTADAKNYEKLLHFQLALPPNLAASPLERKRYKACAGLLRAFSTQQQDAKTALLAYFQKHFQGAGDALIVALIALDQRFVPLFTPCRTLRLAQSLHGGDFAALRSLGDWALSLEEKRLLGLILHRKFGPNLQVLGGWNADVREVLIMADLSAVLVDSDGACDVGLLERAVGRQ
ncbi:hypothetical protein SS50377_24553 [Spironucleus salmonicida]|uniref:Uncharacterized protein n=1 Tax=Spironucleus salmonicida TaxID=348837 RepID=V6LMQ1_9EUKA|nr:hypothetical protein SS50377_24553 [Spironucleus salmonicida]|eukprot:EST45905.1 Hypothetical protein SS50377_13881 [Spironucleus salmonicida]